MENNLLVHFKGCKEQIGTMADVKLVEEKGFLLYGRADPWLKNGKSDTNDAAVYADQMKRIKIVSYFIVSEISMRCSLMMH